MKKEEIANLGIHTKKKWENHWVCHPDFEKEKKRDLLHKQLDNSFIISEHKEELKNFHTMFRKKFMIKEKKKAILDISADDYYKLYVNGEYVTQGPANSYAFCYYYNKVDITQYLKEGENVIAVHVYYQGLINRVYNSADYRQGMIAELWIGEKQVLDEKWKCKQLKEFNWSRTIAYDTQFDEIIDNRKKILECKKVCFDDSNWLDASVCESDDHILILQPSLSVEIEEKKPVMVDTTESGYLLDFGEELTGTLYMIGYGKAGDEIIIRYGEELSTEQEVRYEMRCNCLYEDKWILNNGKNELEQYEYKCFRYVQIIFPQENDNTMETIKLKDYKVLYRHYPFHEKKINISTDNEELIKIWEICKNAVRNCSQESFLDCPSREKGQYLGDLTVTAHSMYYLTGDTALFRKALIDFAHSTIICKGMMAVVPGNFMQEIADFSLLYPYQLLLYYNFTKDKKFLEELVPVIEGIEEYFKKFENEDGMLENVKTKWNLVDWPENLRDCYDFDLSEPIVGNGCHNVINALYIGMKECMEEIYRILNFPSKNSIDSLKQTFIDKFYDKTNKLFKDSTVSQHHSLHANVFASFYKLEPKDSRIPEFIIEKGLSCGVFVSYFVLFALIKMGRKEEAYHLLLNRTEHSWYNMLKEGATTAYEAWGKEQKWNTSLCHAWAAAPIPIIMKLIELGVIDGEH